MRGVSSGPHVDAAYGQPTAVTEIRTDPANNERSTADTVTLMRRQALKSSLTPEVQRFARHAQAGLVGPRDRRDRANGVHHAVKQNVRFIPDERMLKRIWGLEGAQADRELLVSPEVLLSMPRPAGDCDCHAMLAAAALLANGVPPVLTTIAQDPAQPRRWSHIYAQGVLEDGSLYPIDTSHGPYPGWEEKRAYRRRHWPLIAPRRGGGRGMGCAGNGGCGCADCGGSESFPIRFPPGVHAVGWGARSRGGLGLTFPSFPSVPTGGAWGGVLQDLARAGGSAGLDILGRKVTPEYQFSQGPGGGVTVTQRSPQGAAATAFGPPMYPGTTTPMPTSGVDQSTLLWMALIAVLGVGAAMLFMRGRG